MEVAIYTNSTASLKSSRELSITEDMDFKDDIRESEQEAIPSKPEKTFDR